MPALNPEAVEFPTIVNDMVNIHIHDDALIDIHFQYEIADKEEKILRRGHFFGTRVQIRIAHLPDGRYFFRLHFGETGIHIFCFEKISDMRGRRVRDDW